MKKMMKNTIVTVYHIVGQTAMSVLDELGNNKFRFTTDAYVDDADMLRPGVFKHLRQAIPARKGKVVQDIKEWPRLRWALHNAGLQPVNIPGGDYPLHYTDEIAVPDFSMSGSHFFIVSRKKIGGYLDKYPLGERGLARRQEMEQAELDKWLESRDPDCISKKIGSELWRNYDAMPSGGEFTRITLVDKNGCKKSVIFPSKQTDIIWNRCGNVSKIVCAAPETGVEFLDPKAANVDPREHYRIKKVYCPGWSRYTAYLQPKASLADCVSDEYRWLGLFDNDSDDVFTHQEIADAKKIILENFSLTDKLLPGKLVYTRENGVVFHGVA